MPNVRGAKSIARVSVPTDYPMFSATFYFLGVAGFIVAASACLSRGKQVGRRIEVDLSDLHAASVCLVTAGNKPTWDEIRALWIKWYARCQEKAILKQKAIYSWARTLALCAVLCLMGVLLEAEFDEHVSVRGIWAGISHSRPAAADRQMPPPQM